MGPVRSLLFALAALAAVLLPAAPAAALSYPVTSTGDAASKGTLRGSIEEANAHMGADTIPIEATGTIQLDSALPTIDDDVTIAGPGNLIVERSDTASAFRIFEFVGVLATVSDLTVRGGVATTGAGILNAGGNLTLIRVVVAGNEAASEGSGSGAILTSGGGVLSTGSLTLRESFIHGNEVAARGGEESTAAGGGVEAEGALTVERSTISGNSVRALAQGGRDAFAFGGGIALASGAAWIEESTISGNSVFAAEGPDSNIARGGGIQGDGISLTGSTVADNSVDLGKTGDIVTIAAGANLDVAADSSVRNSLVAEPRGDEESCAAQLPSAGYNLDEDGSCEFDLSSDLNQVPAGLNPVLAANGGPTPTHALLSGSIAIDRGASFGDTTDQRGLPRPSDFPAISNKEGGDGSDIGAFELQVPPGGSPAPPVPILVGTESSDRTAPRTRIISGPARVGYERRAKFRFTSSEGQSTFQCRVDRKPYRKCRSPYKLKVAPGKHHFRVRAIDRFGNVDRTAARFSWRVKPVG